MPLHIEPLVNDIIAQVRSALPTQLASVAAATDTSLALTAPPTERYYIGEPNRYSSYNAPSIFVITETTDLPLTNRGAAAKIANRDYRLVEMYSFVAVVYFIVSFGLSLAVRRLQAR